MNFEKRIVRQALLEWLRSKSPMDRVLSDAFREHRVGSAQRPLVAQALFSAVRYLPLVLPPNFRPEDPAQLRALDERLDELFQGGREALQQLHLKGRPKAPDDILGHVRRHHGLSPLLLREFEEAPDAWHAFLHQMMEEEAPLCVRLNDALPESLELPEKWRERKLQFRPSDWLPRSFVFDQRVQLVGDEDHQKGLFEIQDEHSQLIAHLAAPLPGERILDLCAGAGGKTLHLANLLQGRGEIVAYDLVPSKLATLQARARRTGFSNIRISEHLPKSEPGFDLILVDAPCSGLGTLRRGPDRLWRFSETEARQLATVQQELLHQALARLRPGGRLLYATCTVRPEENLRALKRLQMQSPKALKGLEIKPRLAAVLGAEKTDKFLALAQGSPAARLARESEKSPWPTHALQVGPHSQASGALIGDAFFVALVKS